MFKRSLFSKIEMDGLPEPLTDLYVSKLLYDHSNFAVVELDHKELWLPFLVTEPAEMWYNIPEKIQVMPARGGVIPVTDFCLFSNFDYGVVPYRAYVNSHTAIIQLINKTLIQHITASELVATLYANSKAEYDALCKLYENFPGVKVVKHDSALADSSRKADFYSFDVQIRTADLEQLKRDIENDLFLRLGIYTGIEKTHLTNINVENSEQVRDLINAFDMKQFKDFERRLNEWRVAHGIAERFSARIHAIDNSNSIKESNENESDD